MRAPLKTFTERHAQFLDSHLDSFHTHVARGPHFVQNLSFHPISMSMFELSVVIAFCSYSFLLFLLELLAELDNPIVKENLRDFAEESEDTLNVITSPTDRPALDPLLEFGTNTRFCSELVGSAPRWPVACYMPYNRGVASSPTVPWRRTCT